MTTTRVLNSGDVSTALGFAPARQSDVASLTAAQADTSQKVAAVSTFLSGAFVLRQLTPESGYLFAATDAKGRASFAVGTDGTFTAFNYASNSIPGRALAAGTVTAAVLSDGAVTSTKLDPASVGQFLAKPLSPESGYVWGVVDAAGRVGLGVQTDGTVVGKFAMTLPAGTVTTTALADTAVSTAKIADGAATTSKLADGGVTAGKLDPNSVGQFLAKALPRESGYLWGVFDASGKMALGVQVDGTFIAPKATMANQSVDFAQLTPNLSTYVARPLSPESGYVWGVVDAAGKVGLAIQPDGTVIGKVSGLLAAGSVGSTYLANGAVTEAKLDPPIDRLAVPHITDVVEVEPDPWRATYGQISVRTSADGSGWSRFPYARTRNLRGLNTSGTALQFRRSAGLLVRGRRFAGAWSPVATTSATPTVYKGFVYSYAGALSTNAGATAALPASGTANWYYRYASATTLSYNGQTLVRGDLIIWDGAQWAVQKGPITGAGGAPDGGRQEGDWWIVTAAGTYDGVSYAAGDRLVYVGFDSYAGNGNALWYKGKPAAGECFYQGEFAAGTVALPTSGSASPPFTGDLWQASAVGTDATTGLTFAVGDYALYDSGQWAQIATGSITSVAAGAMIPALSCHQSASEWEVRRADKSGTIVGAGAYCLRQASPRRSVDNILLLSDSMFGVANTQGLLSGLVMPRSVSLISRGGGTSRNVLSTYENYIASGGDPYRGDFTFLWQGQNNQPVSFGDANWSQITETALRVAELIGSRDRRFCFLSILGIDAMTFDGARIHVTQHEAMFAGAAQSHVLWQLEQWYATMFPGQWLSPRLALLNAAANSTILDARLPGSGMTEAQTAAAYGWVPLSFWNAPSGGWPIALGNLNLKGYWNSVSLPTGGANGDCYTLSVATSYNGAPWQVGTLLINVNGTWTPCYADQTHQGSALNQGGQYLAAALAAYLSSNNL
jgi:hypothetical protein